MTDTYIGTRYDLAEGTRVLAILDSNEDVIFNRDVDSALTVNTIEEFNSWTHSEIKVTFKQFPGAKFSFTDNMRFLLIKHTLTPATFFFRHSSNKEAVLPDLNTSKGLLFWMNATTIVGEDGTVYKADGDYTPAAETFYNSHPNLYA